MLRVSDLACARGGFPVLEGVRFEIGPGEAILLRGPNGCGKTTLLRTIVGLQPQTAGAIAVEPDSIAYCGHLNGIKPMLTVAENLEFWAAVYSMHRIDRALEAFGISGLRDRLARNLSAGQCRRLGLARILVTGCPIWALDEPTVSLDANGIELFTQTMRGHLESGGSAIVATHSDLNTDARELDVAGFRVRAETGTAFDRAFR